jgi:hypothetical protein
MLKKRRTTLVCANLALVFTIVPLLLFQHFHSCCICIKKVLEEVFEKFRVYLMPKNDPYINAAMRMKTVKSSARKTELWLANLYGDGIFANGIFQTDESTRILSSWECKNC